MTTLRQRIAHRLFGDIIEQATAAAITVRVDDSTGWDSLTPGPSDRPWAERQEDLTDALEAWRKNFLVRRIVTLTRSYVVGGGIIVSSRIPEIDTFIKQFWDHEMNHMDSRLGPMCDEFTRVGEIFPILFTNKIDGMSYIRFAPATQIREVETDPDDYETELRYGQIGSSADVKWWIGPNHPHAYKTYYKKMKPLMLHFAVNRPIGGVRGEGDLAPVLPWVKRYSEWLKDRVRLNRQRTRQGVLDITIADDSMVQDKRQQLRTSNPIEHGIYVHGPGETVAMHGLEIDASEAQQDGMALRLAVAAGSQTALHYLGEGAQVNYATAKEMGEPTSRFFTERQNDIESFLKDIITAAYRRKVALQLATMPADDDLQLSTSTTEVARADNQGLATAANTIVQALRSMREIDWIDDQTAVKIAFKFAGETLGEEEINRILAAEEVPVPTEEE